MWVQETCSLNSCLWLFWYSNESAASLTICAAVIEFSLTEGIQVCYMLLAGLCIYIYFAVVHGEGKGNTKDQGVVGEVGLADELASAVERLRCRRVLLPLLWSINVWCRGGLGLGDQWHGHPRG